MKTLVTGGAGFLGSHLVVRLLQQGHEVTVLDDLRTGSLANLPEHPRLTFVHHDVTKPYSLPAERIYNLACPASPLWYQADPIGTTLTSVLGAHHALELAVREGARVLQASTSEIYGDPEVHPQPEDYPGRVSPCSVRSCYEEGKRCAESLVADYHRTRGADVRIARIFNVYGPKMRLDDGRVLANFVRQALQGEPLTVYGDGTQTRSLCYVDDLVEGLVALMEETAHPGPVNLGNPQELTILQLAQRVLELLPGSPLVHRSLPADDPRRRRPDISLASTLFGFRPQISLEQGLPRLVEDVRRRL